MMNYSFGFLIIECEVGSEDGVCSYIISSLSFKNSWLSLSEKYHQNLKDCWNNWENEHIEQLSAEHNATHVREYESNKVAHEVNGCDLSSQ